MDRRGDTGPEDEWLTDVAGDWVKGTIDDGEAQLRALEEAGVQRVMLQLQSHQDLAVVDLIGDLAARVASPN
jgi:hypothetical protein